jgi:hypothetical protein
MWASCGPYAPVERLDGERLEVGQGEGIVLGGGKWAVVDVASQLSQQKGEEKIKRIWSGSEGLFRRRPQHARQHMKYYTFRWQKSCTNNSFKPQTM